MGSERKLRKAVKAGDLAQVKALVESGVSPSTAYNDHWNEGVGGISMLHIAARAGNEDIVAFLVEKGADLNARDSRQRTPLHVAASNGQTGAVALLLKAGADPNLRDRNGQTPAQSTSKRETSGLLDRYTEDPLYLYGLAEKKTSAPEKPAPVVKTAVPEWSLVNETLVARNVVAKDIGYRLTDIFDFHSRERIRIVQNLETKQDKVETTAFADIAEKTALQAAFEALTRLGGKAEPPSGIDKPAKLQPPQGATP